MQDRPTVLELLAAVREFLAHEVVPALEGGVRFHARVAANVLAIVERELHEGDEQLREEWARLRVLCTPERPPGGDDAESGAVPPPDPGVLHAAVGALNAELAARIRNGDADAGAFRDAVLGHLQITVEDKLRIANPDYLEQAQP
jgi:hypothetical protein